MPVYIALLRAIGPATHRQMSMRALREACLAAGLTRAETFSQTGNIVIATRKSRARTQAIVAGVLRGFGLANDVIVVGAADVERTLAADPFPDAAATRPGRLIAFFLAGAPNPEGLATLWRHTGPERVALAGDAVCVDYADGVAVSKLSPAKVQRLLGVTTTFRSWNSVRGIARLAATFSAKPGAAAGSAKKTRRSPTRQ